MKIRIRTMVAAALALIFLVVFPITLVMYVPAELFAAFAEMGGFDLKTFLDGAAAIGLAVAAFVMLRGYVEKASRAGLGVSVGYSVLRLLIVLYVLGLGNIGSFGLAVLGSTSGGASNTVIFDFRLIAILATAILALTMVNAFVEYRERKVSTPPAR